MIKKIISKKQGKIEFVILSILLVSIIIVLVLNNLPNNPVEKTEMKKFSSLSELENFVKTHSSGTSNGMMYETSLGIKSATLSASADGTATAYSQTNIQVAGVDEPDIIKNDNKYIYAVSGNTVFIINAYPASEMRILSEINFSGEYVQNIFINGNKLIVFSQGQTQAPYDESVSLKCQVGGDCWHYYDTKQISKIYVYDTSDKNEPKLKQNISVDGSYVDARMIGDYIYTISNQYVYPDYILLPEIVNNGNIEKIAAESIYYPDDNQSSFQFTTILALNLKNNEISEKVILSGIAQNIYVSENNIYTSYTKYSYHPYVQCIVAPCYPSENEEKTVINKISVDKLNINFVAIGEVPGQVLNQFSMDEYDGYFRIATTKGEVWGGNSKNNIYVLNSELNISGKLEDLAPGEKIYSARFLGKRVYLVTFKKIDPLFVISLENPEDPKVLGQLKIPGYSDYLHPYDENHIIGIGKEAIDAESDLVSQRNLDFAWYQGVKMAIFDVSDVENPKELFKEVIGDRGTDSYALQDHKAFLFDKAKELLVIPITLAEIKGNKTSDNQYGEYTFQGAYVYKINLQEGFKLKGRITHYENNDTFMKSGYYFRGDRNIQRSLYLDNMLYTFSNKMIKANNLDSENLEEINSIELPIIELEHYPYYYGI